jgi:large subunit ribosomal protein L17
MRHGISGNKLSRNQSLRKATMRDMARAILIEERIFTTKAKAKEGRKFIEKLITMGKKGTLAEKRRAFAILCDHQMVSDLFDKTAPRFKNRMGGYTRIIPFGNRRGDNAEMVYLELTEKSKVIVSKRHLIGTSSHAPVVSTTASDVATVSDAEVVETPTAKSKSNSKTDKKASAQEPAKKDAPAKKAGGIKSFLKKKSEG